MKKTILVLALIIAQVSFAQVTKNLGDFDELKVFDQISVEVVPSGENRIVISGKRSNDVEVVNNNGQLKIRMKLEKLLSGDDVDIKLYSSGLRSIDVSEGSYVESAATLSQSSLELIAKEGGEIKLNVELKKLNIKAVTGGRVIVSGTADNSDINIGTGGIVKAKDLMTTQTSVKISAGGEADVNATDLVDANIKAGGDVTVYGNPKEINEKTTLGGSVRRAKD